MIRILFVCHGNICRSPMAEFVFNDLVEKQGLVDRLHAESAATSYEEIGNPVYPPVLRLLAGKGIDASRKQARRIRKSDLAEFDWIIGMDQKNMQKLKAFFGESARIRSLLEREVADPWYTGRFDVCYADILEGCTALIRELSQLVR